MFPEAGGSSSFARHAFNEFVSFFAAWAQMLNYVITVAISAFFVPHYLGGLFWDPLRSAPGDVIFGVARDHRAVAHQRRRHQGVGGPEHRPRARRLLHPAAHGRRRRAARLLAADAGRQHPPRRGADVDGLPARDPAGDDRLHRHRDDLQHGRGGQGRGGHDPQGDRPRAHRRVRDLLHAAGRRAVGAAGRRRTRGRASTARCSASPEEDGGFAGDPILGVVKQLDLGFLQQPGELYVGLLAATILLIATNAGIIGVSRLVYSMGIHRQVPDRLRQLHPKYNTPWIGILVFGVIACLTLLPGQADLPRQHVRLRRDAVVHDRACRGHPHASDRRPTASAPTGGPGTLRIAGRELPGFAVFGGLATALSFVVVTALNPVVAVSGTVWLVLGIAIYALYRRRHGLDS